MSKYMTEHVEKWIADATDTGLCEPDCELCAKEVRELQALLKDPTLFQAQLCKAGACSEGLIGVGKQSARAFYNSTNRTDWLRWLWERFSDQLVGTSTEVDGKWHRYTADEFRALYPFEALKAAEKAYLDRQSEVY